MAIEYQNTLEDYKEAYAAHWHKQATRSKSIRQAWPMWAYSAYTLACVAAINLQFLKSESIGASLAATLLIPAFLIAVLEVVCPIVPRARTPAQHRSIVSMLIILLAGGGAAAICTASAGSEFWRMAWIHIAPSSLTKYLLPSLTWVVYWLVVRLSARMATRQNTEKGWSRQITANTSLTLETTATGVVVSSPRVRTEIFWPGMPKFLETAKLFLIYVSEDSFWMVPKRVFPNPQSIEDFRALLNENITHRRSAFEVLPVPSSES